jgi:acetyl-CoA carboxylase carboxyltransferase component
MNQMTHQPDNGLSVAGALGTLLDIDSIQHDAETAGLALARGRIHGREAAVFILREPAQSAADLWQLHAFIVAAGLRRETLIGIHANKVVIDSNGDVYEAQAALLQALAQAGSQAPYLALCAGNLGGVNALLCSLADAVFMLAQSGAAYLSGPASVLAVRGLSVDEQALGGSRVHAVDSGLAARTCLHLADALLQIRRYLGLLGGNSAGTAHPDPTLLQHALSTLRPDEHAAYDMRELIANLVDSGDWFELRVHHGASIITGMARMGGLTVGIVANNPRVNAGCLDAVSCRKAAAFIELCSQRGYALLGIVDTPGFLPGVEQEASGIALAAQALIRAWAQSASARVSLLAGRALGGAGIAMGLGLPATGTAIVWPNAWHAASGGNRAPAGYTELRQPGQPEIVAPSQTRQALVRALMSTNQPNGA